MTNRSKIKFHADNNNLCWFLYLDELVSAVYLSKSVPHKSFLLLISASSTYRLSKGNPAFDGVFSSIIKYFKIDASTQSVLTAVDTCKVLFTVNREKNYFLDKLEDASCEEMAFQYDDKYHYFNWRTSYDTLAICVFAKESYTLHQAQYLQVNKAQIFGIHFSNLKIRYNRQNRYQPIETYTAKVYEDGSPKAYFDTKNRLLALGGQIVTCQEDDITRYRCSIALSGLHIKLVYPSRQLECYTSGATSMVITNKRAYPDLLDLGPYEALIQTDEVIILPYKIHISHEYRKSEFVKNVPKAIELLHRTAPLLWIDRKNGMLGVTDHKYCNLFQIDEISSFFLQNVAPARGPGWSQFGIVHHRYGELGLVGSRFEGLDTLVEELEEKTNIRINRREMWYDC